MSILDYPGLTRYDSNLKDFLNGVAKQTVSKSQTDLDTLVDQGIYYVTGTVADHHFPIGTNGTLLVLRTSATAGQGFCQQFFRRTGTAGTNDHQIFVRECGSGGTGTWGGWKQLMTSNHIVASTGSATNPVYINASGVTTACTSSLTDYLPLAGGTMSGVITRNGILAQSGNTSGSIAIQNGTAASGGGGIWMYGASNTNAGKVRLQAYDSTNKKYCALDANGDGTLTWCGNELATDSNVVHLTGTEDITGKKTVASPLTIKNANLTRGTNPSSNSWIYATFSGSGGDATNQRFGTVASGVYTTGAVRLYLEAYKNTAGTTTNAQLSVTYPASGDPYASAPTTPTGSTGTEIVTADYLNSTNSGVVHTTGNETIAGIKSFTGRINIADGAGITFTSNGVTQTLISSALDSVEGNNAVSLRLGYGGSTYVTGGECAGYITADNGFGYGNENVQLMADSNVYIRTGLNGGWDADLGAVATNAAFRPIADGGMTLGTASYRWGNAYIGTTYMNGSIVFDETATISGTSTRHLANISMNNSSLNFGAYDQTNSKWIWWATPAGVNTFNGNAVTATKATQDENGNVISSTYAKDANVVHLAGAETITGVKTHNAEICMQYSTVTKGTAPTANKYMSYKFVDNAGAVMGGVQSLVDKTSGNNRVRIYAYRNTADATDFGALGLIQPTEGDPYGYISHSTPASATSKEIVTADWVLDKNYATQSWVTDQGYLTKHQSITGKINVSGSRGNLAGYQTPLDVTTATSITYSSRDIIRVNASGIVITVANSSSSTGWIKWVHFTDSGTMSLGSNWSWVGSSGPTITKNTLIMLVWCKTRGWALHMPTNATW